MSSPFQPLSAADHRLLAHVRPARWTNPEPQSRYDLVVVGGGTGGLVSAAIGSALGARVALVERDRRIHDCPPQERVEGTQVEDLDAARGPGSIGRTTRREPFPDLPDSL